MDPLTMSALMKGGQATMNFIPSIAQFITGVKQKKQARNLRKSEYIPESFRQVEATARQRAGATEAPGQSRVEDKVRSGTASTVDRIRKSAKSSASVAEQIQAADAREKARMSDIDARADQVRFESQRQLDNVLAKKAGMEQRNQDRFDAAKSALNAAGARNKFGALTSAVSAGNMTMGNLGIGSEGGQPATSFTGQPANPLSALPIDSGINAMAEQQKLNAIMQSILKRTGKMNPLDLNNNSMGFVMPNS